MSIETGTREYRAARNPDGTPMVTTDPDGTRHIHTIETTVGVEHQPCGCGTDHTPPNNQRHGSTTSPNQHAKLG